MCTSVCVSVTLDVCEENEHELIFCCKIEMHVY